MLRPVPNVGISRLTLFWRSRRGAVSAIMALALIPLIGGLAMGVEVSTWYLTQRALQNAADSAVLAAAANVTKSGETSNCTATGDPCYEARSVAKNYGFVHNSQNVTVTTTPNATCPAGATDCYQVTISKNLPLILVGVVGYRGNATIGSTHYQTVTATAVAEVGVTGTSSCILGLSQSAADAVQISNNASVSNADCGVYSNSSLSCSNNCTVDGPTYAVGSDDGKGSLDGSPNVTGAGTETDPYVGVSTDPGTCTKTATSGTIGPGTYCGINVGNKGTLTLTSGVYYVDNEFILGNNATLDASPAGGVTIIINGTYTISIGNNVTLNVTAQSTGDFAGIALMGPRTGSSSTVQAFGNDTVINVTGAVYFPSQTLTIDNNSTFSSACTQLVADVVNIQNNANIGTNCSGTGVTPIGSPGHGVKLVQ